MYPIKLFQEPNLGISQENFLKIIKNLEVTFDDYGNLHLHSSLRCIWQMERYLRNYLSYEEASCHQVLPD